MRAKIVIAVNIWSLYKVGKKINKITQSAREANLLLVSKDQHSSTRWQQINTQSKVWERPLHDKTFGNQPSNH